MLGRGPEQGPDVEVAGGPEARCPYGVASGALETGAHPTGLSSALPLGSMPRPSLHLLSAHSTLSLLNHVLYLQYRFRGHSGPVVAGSVDLPYKGLGSKYFRLSEPYGLCHNSAVILKAAIDNT